MTPVLYGLILCFYVVQPVVERLLGLLNYLKVMKNCVPISLRKSFGFMVLKKPELFKTIEEIWAPRQCEFVEGFPEDLMSRLEKTNDRGSLCIFDDVMNEVSSNATISKLFTRGRSHLGCSLVLMLQNIFPKGSQSRTISINAQYQVLFHNPRDSLQISILARQLCPLNSKDFLEIYKRATQRPYGYLFCCFTQSCPEVHSIVKTFSKSIKELRKDLMVIYFVVLRNLVLMKYVIVQIFYLLNILLSCISFNFILFCI